VWQLCELLYTCCFTYLLTSRPSLLFPSSRKLFKKILPGTREPLHSGWILPTLPTPLLRHWRLATTTERIETRAMDQMPAARIRGGGDVDCRQRYCGNLFWLWNTAALDRNVPFQESPPKTARHLLHRPIEAQVASAGVKCLLFA